jgi:hypothetical protein
MWAESENIINGLVKSIFCPKISLTKEKAALFKSSTAFGIGSAFLRRATVNVTRAMSYVFLVL